MPKVETDNKVAVQGTVCGDLNLLIRTGKLTVNLDTRVVSVNDHQVPLTGKEYAILELLSLRKGTTVTKEMLLAHLYGGVKEPGLKIIDVFVCNLRKKLAQATGGVHYIETVWGRGCVLQEPRRQWRPLDTRPDPGGCAKQQLASMTPEVVTVKPSSG